MVDKVVIVKEINSNVNFSDEVVGKVVKTFVFDPSDTLGIIGIILTLISECQNIEVQFDESEYDV